MITLPSRDAAAYANRRVATFSKRTSKWDVAAFAFDAGAAHERATHTCPEPPAPVVLTTAAELDALSSDSVIRDRDGDMYVKQGDGGGYFWLRVRSSGSWTGQQVVKYSPLTVLVPATHTCPAEPERLTDPDDPRIRDGALVSVCFPDAEGPESVTYVYQVGDGKGAVRTAAYIRAIANGNPRTIVRLLAEAPEPEPVDDVLRRVLNEWDDLEGAEVRSTTDVKVLIFAARKAGLDIVRKP